MAAQAAAVAAQMAAANLGNAKIETPELPNGDGFYEWCYTLEGVLEDCGVDLQQWELVLANNAMTIADHAPPLGQNDMVKYRKLETSFRRKIKGEPKTLIASAQSRTLLDAVRVITRAYGKQSEVEQGELFNSAITDHYRGATVDGDIEKWLYAKFRQLTQSGPQQCPNPSSSMLYIMKHRLPREYAEVSARLRTMNNLVDWIEGMRHVLDHDRNMKIINGGKHEVQCNLTGGDEHDKKQQKDSMKQAIKDQVQNAMSDAMQSFWTQKGSSSGNQQNPQQGGKGSKWRKICKRSGHWTTDCWNKDNGGGKGAPRRNNDKQDKGGKKGRKGKGKGKKGKNGRW